MLIVTFLIALAYSFGNICWTIWKAWTNWEGANRQRYVTRSAGRGGKRPKHW